MTTLPKRSENLIVGGGVIGLSIAYELLRRGHGVTLVDQSEVGRGTSWAATGILPPCRFDTATDPLDQLRGYSHTFFDTWTHDLAAATGIDCGYRHCGGWYLADSAGEAAAMTGMTAYWDELGIECRPVGRDELVRREPALRHWADSRDRVWAWHAPAEDQIRPPDLLRALATACERMGGVIVSGATAGQPECEPAATEETGTDARILIDDTPHVATRIILCGGSWCGRIAGRYGLAHSVVPIRGQIAMLRSPEPLLGGVVNVGNRYLVTREDGKTLVGSCEEEVGFDCRTAPQMIDQLIDFAGSIHPALASAPVLRSWAGLRPMTFDGFPMIGRVPDHPRLLIAAGHYRSGIHLSCGTAMLIADLIEHQPTAIDVTPFRVGKQRSDRSMPAPAGRT